MTDLEKIFEGEFVIPSSVMKSLDFFIDKYRGRIVQSKAEKEAIGEDIYRLCIAWFNNPEFCNTIKVYRKACHLWKTKQVPKRRSPYTSYRFVKLIDDLECFYDINSNAGDGIKDKRVHLFIELKGRILKTIKFLENRSETQSKPSCPKNPNKHKRSKGSKIAWDERRPKRKYKSTYLDEEEARIRRRIKEGF